MSVCLDTDVAVDCLRGFPGAQQWLQAQSGETLFVPGIVAMELLMGARNKIELDKMRKFEFFHVIWHEPHEFEHAFRLLGDHRLATNLSLPDCLIAATALERSLRLSTFNAKHYCVINGLDVQEPYQRA